MTTKTAAERVAALRDEYARLGENVDHLSDLDLLNEYADIRERECTDTRDRYMRLLTEQRHYGDQVHAAAAQGFRSRIDVLAVQAVERHVHEAAHLARAVEMLPAQPKPEHIARLYEIASSVRHMLRLLEEDRTEWKLDDHYGMVNAARSVVGVLRDKEGIAAEDVIRLVDEALTPNGNLHDLFKLGAAPVPRQQPLFTGGGWAEMGGGSYYTYEPDSSPYRVMTYPVGDTWWLDLQGPTGSLIAAGETSEAGVAETAAALIEQAPVLAKSGTRPWQCWERTVQQLQPAAEAA